MLGDGPALANPEKLQRVCDDLMPHVKNASHIMMCSENGTRIEGKCECFGFESGLYKKPGQGGNFPAGEVYSFGLIESSINGHVFSNIKVKHLGLSAPGNDAIFQVKEGKIEPIETEPAGRFFSLVAKHSELLYIAELAFGISPYDKVYKNPDSIQEEKILGTAHIGLGSNISFGGSRSGKHLDLVFGQATIYIDGKLLMRNGRIVSGFLSSESKEWIASRGYKFTKDIL